jgi:methyl-accepting chemotaxis protein
MTSNTETILIVLVTFIVLAVVIQAAILAGMYVAVRKTAKVVEDAAGDLKATVIPMVHTTRELVQRITPQVVTVTLGMAELTETIQRKSPGVTASVDDIAHRVGRQLERLDSMLTASLNALEKATNVVESTVSAPVRQVNGIIAAIRAVIETYRSETPRRPK